MIAEVETHDVAEGEHIVISLRSKHQAANGTESQVWFVQSSLYFVGEKAELLLLTPIVRFPQPTMWVSEEPTCILRPSREHTNPATGSPIDQPSIAEQYSCLITRISRVQR